MASSAQHQGSLHQVSSVKTFDSRVAIRFCELLAVVTPNEGLDCGFKSDYWTVPYSHLHGKGLGVDANDILESQIPFLMKSTKPAMLRIILLSRDRLLQEGIGLGIKGALR